MPQAVLKPSQTPAVSPNPTQVTRRRHTDDTPGFVEQLAKAREQGAAKHFKNEPHRPAEPGKNRTSSAKPAAKDRERTDSVEHEREASEAPSEPTTGAPAADAGTSEEAEVLSADQPETNVETEEAGISKERVAEAAHVGGIALFHTAVAIDEASVESEPDAERLSLVDALLADSQEVMPLSDLPEENVDTTLTRDSAGQIKLPPSEDLPIQDPVDLPETFDPIAIEPAQPVTEVVRPSATDSEAEATDVIAKTGHLATKLPPAGDAPVATEHLGILPAAFDATGQKVQTADASKASAPPLPSQGTAEARFAEANYDNIVRGVQSELLASGGSMRLRLDPPQLGDLIIQVRMQDGVMTASFETSSDQATKLLSHNLGQLKGALEAQGVNVDKLQVQQAPKSEFSQNGGNNSDDPSRREGTGAFDSQSARQQQQRREMLQRMWRRLAGGGDPLDLVA